MKEAAYDVITAQWPNCKVGNYGDSSLDGAAGPTGWFYDLPHSSARFKSKTFRQGWTDRQPWGSSHYSEVSGRYLTTAHHTSGNFDAPYHYNLGTTQLLGFGPDPHTPGPGWPLAGHQQPNIYRPKDANGNHALEDNLEASLRLSRHAVESARNSGSGENQSRLMPWVAMVYAFTGDVLGLEGSRRNVCRTLAMLRASRVENVMLWSHNTAETLLPIDWAETLDLTRRVFSPRIEQVKPVIGDVVGTNDNLILLEDVKSSWSARPAPPRSAACCKSGTF